MNPFQDKVLIIEEQIGLAYDQFSTHAKKTPKPLIVAASKSRSAIELRELYPCGIHAFGENYLQEALSKIEALSDLDIEWHFIGKVQSNKCKIIANHFSWVHTIDKDKTAAALNRHRTESSEPLNVCIQLKLDNEESKGGISPEDLLSLAQKIINYPNLKLRGLMAIPKKRGNIKEQRAVFAQVARELATLKTKLNNLNTLDTLSMGMSEDFESAILEGASIVRIGSALFGPRPKV